MDIRRPKRLLDPIDRVSEILFGLIMVLSFTSSISAAEEGRAGIRAMLIGALGCNFAWGLIDGIMYLMARLSERGQGILMLRAVSADEAYRRIADALPEVVSDVLGPEEYETIRQRLKQLPEAVLRSYLPKEDWLGALAVFLLVFVSTFPVVLPFIFVRDPSVALRISNGVAVTMLFLTGHAFGRYAGYRPWLVGFFMVLLGLLLVAISIALGG